MPFVQTTKQRRKLEGKILCLVFFAWVAHAVGAPSLSGRSVNFVVIIADDLGFSDLGCYGGEIATPNLDRLASRGLRFTQFYNTARCWPTRSALLTGYYPQQIRRDGMPGSPQGFGGRGKRPSWAKTIAVHLRQANYRNYHSGKWHLDGKPTDQGF
ncbi:MAG: sulfatase-like hydrolase/transferase, partial [Planctomycetota bacterium]